MTQQKKRVLGRGLNALIPKSPRMDSSDDSRDPEVAGSIASIPVSTIQPNPFQPRTDFDQVPLEELMQSIREKGIVQPITVRKVEGGYQIIAGERRLRAAQLAKMQQIPAYIIEVSSDEDMLELALVENIQREHLNPMEVALAYRRLLDECKLTQEDVAKKVGKDRTTVTNFLRLLKLPVKVQDGLRKGKISMGHARALVNIPNERSLLRVFERIVHEGLSVRKVEDIARGSSGKSTTTKKSSSSSSSGIQSIEEQLRQALGTKVLVRPKSAGKGDIVIEFYSLDEFDRLLEILTSTSKYH